MTDTQALTPAQEKRKKMWDRLAYYGENIVRRGEDVKWKTGDLARMISKKWDREAGTLMAFAVAIKLARPRTIYDYHEVASYYEKSARRELIEDCPMLSWSHFRAAMRHCKRAKMEPEEAIPLLWSANDNMLNVEEFEDRLRSDPNGDWLVKRNRIPGEIMDIIEPENEDYADVIIRIPKVKVQALRDQQKQREFISMLATRWEEQAVK